MDQLQVDSVFPTLIYSVYKPEFLDIATIVCDEFLAKRHQQVELNEAFPCYMTENVNVDPRMLDFANYVAQTAWNILDEQGYDVKSMQTYFTEMWCQEHHKGSLMEQHTHGNGCQITGFYFLNAPKENAPRAVFYDPKPAKVQVGLPETNMDNLTPSSIRANYPTTAGNLIFTNSWLPHSFTKNIADEPLKFIHFNVSLKEVASNFCQSTAEVI
jgi:hypothetical protein